MVVAEILPLSLQIIQQYLQWNCRVFALDRVFLPSIPCSLIIFPLMVEKRLGVPCENALVITTLIIEVTSAASTLTLKTLNADSFQVWQLSLLNEIQLIILHIDRTDLLRLLRQRNLL